MPRWRRALSQVTVVALQIGSDPAVPPGRWSGSSRFEGEIAASGATVVVLPEAILGGYPTGQAFGARPGYRTDAGREAFARDHAGAADPEVRTRCDFDPVGHDARPDVFRLVVDEGPRSSVETAVRE